jgi:hypothetical protein
MSKEGRGRRTGEPRLMRLGGRFCSLGARRGILVPENIRHAEYRTLGTSSRKGVGSISVRV